MLEDLIKAALNQAKEKVEEMSAEEMKKITGGLAITSWYENAILNLSQDELQKFINLISRLPGIGQKVCSKNSIIFN